MRRIRTALPLALIAAYGAVTGTAHAFDPLPMELPPAGVHAAAERSVPKTWLIGIAPTDRARTLAARHGARAVTDNAVVVASTRARALARILRRAGVLRYAEPDVRRRRASALDGHPEQWARVALVPAALPAPPVGGVPIGVLDDVVDLSHPDVGGNTTVVGGAGLPPQGPHGTMVASVVAAPAGNGGVMGVLPGAPVAAYGTDLSCSDIARGIVELMRAGVGVINLSLGSPEPCVTELVAIQIAIGRGIVVVAAAGNEFQQGNPVVYPAAYPHVLSVAGVRPDLAPAAFSSANAAVDVSAPGQGVPVAVPPALDVEDGQADGITAADGTSFAAPMVAGAAAWLRTVRSDLSGLQTADALRYSAADLGPPGWDPDTGWGIVSVPGAVAAPTPAVDPLEPNDDIPFVDGTFFGRADPPIFRGRGSRRLSASVDFAEDPWDVYRFRMAGRSSVKVTLRPRYGDPDLFAYRARARHVGHRIIARSERVRGADRVRLVNRGRRSASGYLGVRATAGGGTIDSGYTLRVQRTR